MALLVSDGYRFPLIEQRYDFEPGLVDIWIGNPKCKPKPCINISAFEEKDAILNDIAFYPTCSISEKTFLRRSNAMKHLVMASLRWLIDAFPAVDEVQLTDKSYFGNGDQIVMLPEKMVLCEGATWYQKHLFAEPADLTRITLKRYVALHKRFGNEFRALPIEAWYETNISNTLKKYDGFLARTQLSGSVWKVSKETILSYPISTPILVQEGGNKRQKEKGSWMKACPKKIVKGFWKK